MSGFFTKTPALSFYHGHRNPSIGQYSKCFVLQREESRTEKAHFYKNGNTPTINPFAGTKHDRLNILKEIEERNTRVKKKGLHISVNPIVTDLVKLGDKGIRTEIGNLMEH